MLAAESWTNVWTGTSYCFPGILMQQANLFEALQRFKYYRADVKVTIKLQTNQFHQGSLMVSWIPGWQSSTAPSIYTLSGCHAVVLSASTQDSCDILIPYLAPANWMYCRDQDPQNVCIARLFIKVLNPLIVTSGSMSNTVPVTVFASFTNLRVSGYASNEPSSWKEKLKRMSSNNEAHSGSGQKNVESAVRNSSGIDSKPIVKVASSLLRKAPVIGDAYGAVADFLKGIAGDLSKPISQAAPMPIIATQTNNASLTSGINVVDQITMYPNANLTQSVIYRGMQSSHITVSKLAQQPMLHRTDTLDGMSSSFSMRCTPLVYYGPNKRSHDWLYYAAYAFRWWRGSIKYLFHVCMPGFYSTRVRISIEDQYDAPVENRGEIPSKIVDIKGDSWIEFSVPYHRITDWVDPRFETSSGSYLYVPAVKFELLYEIIGSSAPSNPVMYVNTWRAAGEDTEFSGLIGARDGVSAELEAHANIAEKFLKPFDPPISNISQTSEKGTVAPEIALTVSDCLKRASSHIPLLTVSPSRGTFPAGFPAGTANANFATIGREPFHYFSYPWQFWRGSRVLKHYQAGDLRTLKSPAAGTSWGDGGAFFFSSAANAALRYSEGVCIPWSAPVQWIPMFQYNVSIQEQFYSDAYGQGATYIPVDFGNLTTYDDSTYLTIEAGDDFMLLHPLPFFPLAFYPDPPEPSSTKEGVKGRRLIQSDVRTVTTAKN